MSDASAELSRKLCEVLERVGVSESMRKIYRDTSFLIEIVDTILHEMEGLGVSNYMFGSSCEGTTTPGMGSDEDCLQCIEHIPVIESVGDAPPGKSLLMVTDRHTRPGYVKLQLVQDGIPLTRHNYWMTETHLVYDCKDRVCWKRHTTSLKLFNERNGPADTLSNDPNMVPIDIISALRCRTFPQIARYSFDKCVSCGWLSQEEVESLKKLGALLVGTGHPASEERDIEWRVSFSFQERQLILALNPVQHKCFVLLKIIKNIITAGLLEKKSLTSYHCKTCLLTVITDTGPALWTENNLIKCLFICLNKLVHWVSSGNCPNFFMEESNMFERQEFMEVQERLLHYLQSMVNQGPSLFYQVKSDHIGKALRGRASRQIEDARVRQVYTVLAHQCTGLVRYQNEVLMSCHELESRQHATCFLFRELCYLTTVIAVTEHTQEETQMAVRLLVPIVHKLYAQQLASVAFSSETPATRQRLLGACDHHLCRGKKCDQMTGCLLEATVLYRGGHLESCRDLLEGIERSIHHGAVMSWCECHSHQTKGVCNDHIKQRIASGKINSQNIMEVAVAPCMMFLPSQSEIAPKALQYEMYRSVGASTDTRDEDCDDWFDWAAVDSKIYLHFMQYLVYSDLDQSFAKRIAIDQIWKKLLCPNENYLEHSNLGHRETAYNLLGWIYMQEGQLPEALECFRHSWRIRPDHNAARWHVPELCMRLLSILPRVSAQGR